MNYMNRKLFKQRPARDKLNKMGGIMASSQPLMDTVQKFAPGGAVNAPPYARVNPNVRTAPTSQVRIPSRTPGPVDPNLAALQRANDPRGFARFAANVANLPAAAYDTLVGLPAAALQNLSTAAQFSSVGRALGLSEPGEERPEFVGSQVMQPKIRDIISENQPLSMEDIMAPGRVETMRGPTAENMQERTQGTEQDAAVSDNLASEYLRNLGVSDDSFIIPGVTPSPRREAERTRQEEPAAEAFTTNVPPGEADKQVTEAADIAAVFDQSNTPTQSDPLGTSAGTDMEELKKKVMALMPKYDEEASTKRQGLLLAQMGAAIAAGKSGDAMQNIAEGIQKTLPAFIREGERRDKFKKELEAGAAKIAVTEGLARDREARAEQRAIDKEGRQKKNYFLESDVDMNIGGRQITGKTGQLVRLSDNQVDRALAEGIPLTTENALVNQLKLRAQQVESGTGTISNLYNDKAVKYSPETSYFKGVRFYEPNPKGAQAGLTNMFTTSSLNQIQSAYTNQKNELTSSLYLVDAGIQLAPQATGAAGTFGRMRDQFIGVIGDENAKRFGLDPKSLSGASEFDVMQRMMAAKFAPLLLGESGKTISDQDRARVAALLGINLDTGETFPGFFNNSRQVEKALREVRGILLQNNAALDNEYTSLLQGSIGPGMQPISVQPVGGDNLGVPSKITLSEEEFQRYLGQ